MPVSHTVDAAADDKKTGVTLDELAAFVQRAMRMGAAGTEPVEVTTVGWLHPRVKTAKVTVPVVSDARRELGP